jgi:hypothetical protein
MKNSLLGLTALVLMLASGSAFAHSACPEPLCGYDSNCHKCSDESDEDFFQQRDRDMENHICIKGSVDNCTGLPNGTACVSEHPTAAGQCNPTPLTAGGFCMCYPNK